MVPGGSGAAGTIGGRPQEVPQPVSATSTAAPSDAPTGVDAGTRAGAAAAVAAVPAVAVVLVAAVLGRRLWFFSDDWNILADYHDGGLLEPFNGHLSLLPAGLYRLVFLTLGVDDYLPFRLLGLAALVLLGYQVARFAAERLSWSHHAVAWAALVVAAVLWNSTGVTNVMFPFLMNFSLPIAALVAVWRHLDRDSTGHDVAASAWLAVALASSGLGVMALVAVVVELAVSRAPLRRWAVLSPAPLAWCAWFLSHRGSNEWSTDVGQVASYAWRMLLGGTTSLAAGWEAGGVVLAMAFLALLAMAALRWRTLDARALGALAAAVGFVASTAVTRLDIVPAIPPDEVRYSWTVAAYLVLVVVVVWRPGPDLALLRPLAGALAAACVVVLGIGAAELVRDVRDWADLVASDRPRLESVVLATELVGAERVDQRRVLPLSYVPVTAGGYLAAVAHVGSPVGGREPVVSGSDPGADALLVEELPITATELRPDRCDAEERRPVGPDGSVEVAAGSTVALWPSEGSPHLALAVSRFSAAPGAVALTVPVPGPVAVSFPDDAGSELAHGLPYRLLVGTSVSYGMCR